MYIGEDNVLVELAQMEEAKPCMRIIDDARAFQQAQGFTQWTKEYPTLKDIRNDIANQKGYVVRVDGKVVGYMCIDFAGEPAYDKIEGAWSTDEPYAVVHRLAISEEYRGKQLTRLVFELIESICLQKDIHSIRVDTDGENKRMQYVLQKRGFVPCGVVEFGGGPKLAFDKQI